MSARKTALDALIACRKEGAWSNGVLKDYIARDRLDRRDAALATRLCYGVLQNRNRLDFYLAQLLTGKLKDLHPLVRDILRSASSYPPYMKVLTPAACLDDAMARACSCVSSSPVLVT